MGQTIQEFMALCKRHVEAGIGEWGLPALIILLGVASFGLGRFSALEEARPAISFTTAPELAEPRGMYPGGLYVASRSGSAYYYPWCAGAAKILPANQRWFASEEEARRAGYAPAKNCRGLGD
jgi:hypothetical protein